MLEELQYRILMRFSAPLGESTAYVGRSKLRANIPEDWLERLTGKVVADFGCGEGLECRELSHIADQVIGVDIEENARRAAKQNNCENSNVEICETLRENVDAILTIDSFEHFAEPAGVLELMKSKLKRGGCIIFSFGPTWYHPLGGHLFSFFPWSHLVFSESTLCRWRANFRDDGATKFSEVEGGLNKMTIARFEKLVRRSGLEVKELLTVPIRKFRWAHSHLTREFTTSVVRGVIVRPRTEA